MDVEKLPAIGADSWRRLVLGLLGYRGATSPEALARRFARPGMSGMTIRRIIELKDRELGTEAGEIKLTMLSGMLELPPDALPLAYAGDRDGIERLQFTRDGGEEVRQFILDRLRPSGRGDARRQA